MCLCVHSWHMCVCMHSWYMCDSAFAHACTAGVYAYAQLLTLHSYTWLACPHMQADERLTQAEEFAHNQPPGSRDSRRPACTHKGHHLSMMFELKPNEQVR